ncbi:L,D-transpeptidase [Occallatibacter riparius]|uniref:L,D-transpeptidase n=1 Tax=Occallatibacter riparius TaxID=1002689 RepID=A0A9J7BRR2_9BACT|nr:L,D-transpeptidase [Occallatibacter riparius]UWZ85580.1 L,D-transpeptidase [Occallatibacter riparius]
MKLTRLAAAAVLVMGMAAAAAQDATKRVIVVSLEDRKLALVEDGKVTKVYPVAVGKPSTPSPVGTFTIERRVANPVYQHDGKTVQPGPGNPVGTRWMGLSVRGYGIHGTNAPKSIGKAASHGCIRMAKANLEELFALVQVGDTVELIGERNDETAQLFGTDEGPSPAQQPVLTAQAPVAAPAIAATTAPASADTTVQIAKAMTATAGGTR